MKKNVLVGQSGGPTAVINGSLYGVIYEALNREDLCENVYGMVNGIEGLLNDNIMDMAPLDRSGELELLKTTPGSYLGSCRYKLPEDLNDEVYPILFSKLHDYNIGYFFYIGGNDSMDTVSKLSRYAEKVNSDIRFIGIPKTIDNDLIETDHTPGFGSAAKYVAATIREIGIDAAVYDNLQSITIVEIMGRHAGWLTGASALARKFKNDNPVCIYLPETDFDVDEFIQTLSALLETRSNLVVCISEGIHDKDGKFICEYASDVATDTFGHKMLTGSGKYLEGLVKERLGVKVRSIELNVNQRCSSAYLTQTDLRESIAAGSFGVTCALKGETGKMIAFKRRPRKEPHDISLSAMAGDYAIDYVTVDVNEVCNKEKVVPREWITPSGTNVTIDFLRYILPLIQGKVDIPSENGLPRFIYRQPK